MNWRTVILLALAGGIALAGGPRAQAADGLPGYITAAVNDPGRPDDERSLDVRRKPGEMLAFSGVKPGDRVADILAGGGYFTRIFAKAVGPTGHVDAFDPDDGGKMHGDTLQKLAANPAYSNITLRGDALSEIKAERPFDVVWTSQNYHDLHNEPSPDLVAFNKRVFAMLKPGGVYVVLDHRAAAGAPADVTNTLHRIDPETVKTEVLAAGFTFVGESHALRNPADDHSLKVFDPKIRGKTDQFILKFRKPG